MSKKKKGANYQFKKARSEVNFAITSTKRVAAFQANLELVREEAA